ncbi:MAG: dihydroorotase [Mucinivorans sp.]
MQMIIIHNGLIINQGTRTYGYLVICGERIVAVRAGEVTAELLAKAQKVVDAHGGLILPGVIDDQVHFREPGMTEKGDIASESRAAVAGGVTSFMEMPNTKPAATTRELLEQKYDRAAEVSPANYSFYLGATNDNIKEIEQVDAHRVCGVKVFMGSSTGNMLVDRLRSLEAIFECSPVLVATHSEDEGMIQSALREAFNKYGDNIPLALHPLVRSAEACYRSSAQAVALATKYNARLHVLHLSTAVEMSLFSERPLAEKRITAEVCAHHLWFTDQDYARCGNAIKWNPAIKTTHDRDALREALRVGRLDVVATDHAPHTLEQKNHPYTTCPSGAPLVQHSLVMMLEMADQGIFDYELVVQKMCHNPAILFSITGRGFLREGYRADVVVIKREQWDVSESNILYKCGWSPLQGQEFHHRVSHTFVNGHLAYENGVLSDELHGERLMFDR